MMFVAKFLSNGTRVTYVTNALIPSSQGGTGSRGLGIAVSPDGLFVYVTGQVTQASNIGAIFMIKYNAALNSVLWTDFQIPIVNAFPVVDSRGDAVVVSPDGMFVYVTGYWKTGVSLCPYEYN